VPTTESELRARLERGPVSGFAMVAQNVFLAPSAEEARKLPTSTPNRWGASHRAEIRIVVRSGGDERPLEYEEPLGHYRAVRVVEDLGDVLKIRTGLGAAALAPVDASYDVEVFVRRSALQPVLRTAKVDEYADGTAFVLHEGLVLSLDQGRIRPEDAALRPLPVALGEGDMALGFGLEKSRRELAAIWGGEDMGCDWVRKGARGRGASTGPVAQADELPPEPVDVALESFVAPTSVLRRDRDTADVSFSSPTADGFSPTAVRWPCSFVSRVDHPPVRPEAQALAVGGLPFVPASEFDGAPVAVRKAKDKSDVLVQVARARALVRVLAREGALRPRGMSAAVGRPTREVKVFEVTGDAAAYFPDGRPAGRHTGPPLRLRDASEVGARVCAPRWNLAVPLCHDRKDLREVIDRVP
jgi:hypothetical protein